MKINTKVRYGLKALAYISENTSDGKLVRIKEISESQNISVQYLEQILFKLKNENIIEGKRGPSGGYRLAIPAEEIDLHRIFVILDEEIKVIDCNEPADIRKHCGEVEICGTKCIWSKLDNALTKILKETTLRDFINNGNLI